MRSVVRKALYAKIFARTNEPLSEEQEMNKIQLSWLINTVFRKTHLLKSISMEDHCSSNMFLRKRQREYEPLMMVMRKPKLQ